MAAIFTATGTKLFIGPSAATEPANAAAWAALTPYVEVGFVETIGEYGDESAAIDFAVLGDGRVRKAKGARNAGALSVTVAHIADDAGQQDMEDAELTYNNYAFKVELPNKLTVVGTNEIQYFLGLVMSKRLNVGGNDNVVRKTYNVGVTTKITSVPPT
jgi:hypothetical protein